MYIGDLYLSFFSLIKVFYIFDLVVFLISYLSEKLLVNLFYFLDLNFYFAD